MTDLTDYSEIRTLLDRHGFRFSKSMGQNFLTASWVPERIAQEAFLDADSGVLEIGPGIGCLTEHLSQRAGRVVSIELDRSLEPVLAETLSDCHNTEIVFGDVMKMNIPQLLAEKFTPYGLHPAVCANLPYNITSPLLTKLIEPDCFESITVMIQREVAHRICSNAGEKDYSAFGLFVQWHMDAEILFDVPPSCFVPQPKVTSSVIRLKKRNSKPCSVRNEELMFRIIRASFNQRRKTFANALSSGIPEINKNFVFSALDSAGFPADIRGEAMDISGFAAVSDALGDLLK